MLPEAKKCKQCGEIVPLENYRRYYSTANVPKHYKYCLQCERINSRHKYLRRKRAVKNGITDAETQELQAIEDLYNALRVRGLRPPNTSGVDRIGAIVESQLRIYSVKPIEAELTTIVPEELRLWATRPLEGLDPEYLQETVYEELKAKYRPLKCVDKESLLPVYDDTYKQTLDEILKRFDEYEEGLA